MSYVDTFLWSPSIGFSLWLCLCLQVYGAMGDSKTLPKYQISVLEVLVDCRIQNGPHLGCNLLHSWVQFCLESLLACKSTACLTPRGPPISQLWTILVGGNFWSSFFLVMKFLVLLSGSMFINLGGPVGLWGHCFGLQGVDRFQYRAIWMVFRELINTLHKIYHLSHINIEILKLFLFNIAFRLFRSQNRIFSRNSETEVSGM